MKFIHYSAVPLGELRSVDQLSYPEGRNDKPRGLWFSVGDDEDGWRAWCEGEQFNLKSFAHATEIVFRSDAKVLRIGSAFDLDLLTERHGFDCPYMPGAYRKGYGIDWPAIAQEHDAIVIAPYIYSRRLHDGTHWYYSWDCASGCVWNAAAVERVAPMPLKEAA